MLSGTKSDVWPFTITAEPPGASDMVVPFAVMAGPAALSVWDPMMKSDALPSLYIEPPNVITKSREAVAMGAAIGKVEPSMTTEEAPAPSDTTCVPTVFGGPPGDNVWVPITNCDALFSVYSVEPMVRTGFEGLPSGGARANVCPSMTTADADGASESV